MSGTRTTATKKFKATTSDKIDTKVDAAARDKLITARIGLLLRTPFFGNMATRLSLVNGDSWLTTAATDGRNFYYNSSFINALPPKQVEFLFGHEILHNIYDHLGRVGSRDPQLSNIAQDYVVNADLIDQKVGEMITVVEILHDKKYVGMCWEEVYDLLYQNAKKISIDDLLDKMLDDHLDPAEGESSNPNGNKGEGQNGRPASLSEEERKKVRDEIKEAMIAAAHASGSGNLPGGVKRLLSDLTAPRMDWRELLQQQIESTIKNDFSWMRPSRRGWHQDAIMPGMKPGTTIDVVVAIDTSGSITNDDLKLFCGEIKGIMDSYTEYKIHVITWDTEVYNPQLFTSDNMADIAGYEPMGGGGTNPHCVWDWLREHDIEPKKLIMFTDFDFYKWHPEEVEQYCDTVWIIKGNEGAAPTFGVTAHFDNTTAKK
ncbi:vWFA domain containing protein [uncultured Caudovirales phage]|uniref:VWFA domain containing protein n=1 Tax=uncultured Caudovirales phage TaxID=2100421 RepID=A0A6J5LAC9_9CAUD|nr:vWFA domain containing protein [uncultured Caudovirales phage]